MPRTSTQITSLPVVIPETHLDFVLVGPHNGDQKVLVQSKNLDLLLLGMARTSAHLIAPRTSGLALPEWATNNHPKSIPGLFENDPQATLYSVTAVANVTDQPDAREEPFTFAWIGRSPNADLEPIRDYFRNCVVSLHQAVMDEQPVDQVRWHLAPLLLLCARWTKTTRETEKGSDAGWRKTDRVFLGGVALLVLSSFLSLALGLAFALMNLRQ